MPEPEDVIELGTAFACLTWNDSCPGTAFKTHTHTHTFYRPFISTKTTHGPTTSVLSNNENEVLVYFDSEG